MKRAPGTVIERGTQGRFINGVKMAKKQENDGKTLKQKHLEKFNTFL